MSDIEKAIFKAKLELEIITAEEIQRWAVETLEDNPSHDLALDICFLSTSEQVSNYFKQLSKNLLNTKLTKEYVNLLLNEYIVKNVDLVKTQDTFSFLQKILYLSQSLKNQDLYDLLDYYDDQFNLSFEGHIPSEPNIVLKEFLKDLKNFVVTSE
ncbi:hypothetical protein F975_02391 [Acinetobacter sp. ANC 3789]|uniref:hypothetical protein n=1 Tax=Acinetobacter sp. ANC 3789 TaxID=1217714 RepID=UPI0002CE6CE1|nr:hypothetical protein [Acinetobacter sp. ANC 3789]ENU79762.1 hypothetical protein F975_02391 [Acinetobacter sp. ANC 3789]